MTKKVLLTGEADTLLTPNGCESFLSSLRLLIRVCPNVTVALPAECQILRAEAEALAARLSFAAPVEFESAKNGMSDFAAILSVGTRRNPSLPMTTINSNGWLARVASVREAIDGSTNQENPVGAVAAACLGVSEMFKRLISLKEQRGGLLDEVGFSFYKYQLAPDDPGPALPAEIRIDALLLGAGAIGNGVGYLLSRLPIRGEIQVVDRQDFQRENLGTCMLIGPGDIGKDKATLVAEGLRSGVTARGFRMELAQLKEKMGRDVPYPRVVLSAVDNIETRHDVQRLWPDMVIDGAIGDFVCQASRHPWKENIACMLCLFQEPTGEPAHVRQSRLTGLPEARVIDAEEPITESDVDIAPPERRDWLRQRIGRKICSVIGEAVLQEISQAAYSEGFQPSVPFVAVLSACMMVSELIKWTQGWGASLEPRFQLDVLRGPSFGTSLPQIRRSDCVCVTRRRNIELFRHQVYGG
ncbi:MAG: ThiF family adenylyltransferase [Elusimicrobia bacterium]|nr:ThiF family adenylyltransferase [Elusimicrobiota bacterium]